MTRKIRVSTFAAAALLALGSAPGVLSGQSETEDALTAAEHWLAMTDGGDYAGSWAAGAEFFRNAVSEAQWEQSLGAARKPLGAVVSREVKSRKYTESLPGAPDGEYVVIQFATTFEHKASAIETVTPMLESDGEWRVSGYFIK